MQKPHNLEPFDKRSSWTTNDAHVVSTIAESETMIAWKRVYIEQDNMYTQGATFYRDDNNNLDAGYLDVDSCLDFTIGDSVVIFWNGGEHHTTVTDKPGSPVNYIYVTNGGNGYTNTPNVVVQEPGGEGTQAQAHAVMTSDGNRVRRIELTGGAIGSGFGYTNAPVVTIEPPGTPSGTQAQAVATIGRLSLACIPEGGVPRWAGIRPAVEPETYQVDRRFLADAFGSAPDGSDGGAFIEFMDVPDNPNQNVPKYTAFPSTSEFAQFSNYWFDNAVQRANNVLYLLAGNRAFGNAVAGWGASVNAGIASSLTVVFVGVLSNETFREEAVVHEIGHRFDLIHQLFPYIDTPADVMNHAATDRCVMSYSNNWYNGIAEFGIDALFNGQGAHPGLRSFEDK